MAGAGPERHDREPEGRSREAARREREAARREREAARREREAARMEREAEARAARMTTAPSADPYGVVPAVDVPGEPAGRPPPTARRGDWREEVIGASGLNLIAGVWLILSPFVLGYGDDDAVWNPIVVGAIVGLIAAARMAGAFRQAWLSWINAGIAVWVFASGFWLADTGQASWNSWILGVIVFVLAVWSATASEGAEGES